MRAVHRIPAAPVVLVLALIAVLAGPGPVSALAPSSDGGEARSFPGILLPARSAFMKSKHTEAVREVAASVGDPVRKGQLLLRFADEEERVARDRAGALRDKAQADLARVRALHDDGGTSDDALESAETALHLAQADFDLADLRYRERSLTAPFDGVLTERYVDEGTSVEAGDPLLRVTALGPLRMEALLPESMLPLFAHRVAVELVPSFPDTVIRVTVKLRSLVVDPASGTFPVEVEVDNRAGRLVPGVSCRLTVPGAPAAGDPMGSP